MEYWPAREMKNEKGEKKKIFPIWIDDLITPSDVHKVIKNKSNLTEVKQMLSDLNSREAQLIQKCINEDEVVERILDKTFRNL